MILRFCGIEVAMNIMSSLVLMWLLRKHYVDRSSFEGRYHCCIPLTPSHFSKQVKKQSPESRLLCVIGRRGGGNG